jgi:hypothetical protein
MTPPKTLGAAGRALWQEITGAFDAEATAPLLAELCTTADRLAEVREALKRDGAVVGGRPHPLLNAEVKLQTTFQKNWRLLGLADPDPGDRRGRGRPPGR